MSVRTNYDKWVDILVLPILSNRKYIKESEALLDTNKTYCSSTKISFAKILLRYSSNRIRFAALCGKKVEILG
jgi:hypothetical protein